MTLVSVELFLSIIALGFAAFRITRFIVWSSLIGTGCDGQPLGNGLANPATSMGVAIHEWGYKQNGERQGYLRAKFADLMGCTWCLGFWVSATAYLLWTNPPFSDLSFRDGLAIFAISGIQSLLNARGETIPIELANQPV